jgi:hypothetical protein
LDDAIPGIDVRFIDEIDKILSPLQLIAHPFISCFSLSSDLLGQWRAYADDGRGFAIGFNAMSIKRQLPVTLLRVLYDKEQQVREMMIAISTIYSRQLTGSALKKSDFFEDCVLLGIYMTAFKHPAFAEEQEIRAVHAVNIEKQGNLVKFVDIGGSIDDGKTEVEGNPVSFHVRDNHLTAYIDVMHTPANMLSPISELVFGPKNYSALGNLQLFLGGLGYNEIVLRKSCAPYR